MVMKTASERIAEFTAHYLKFVGMAQKKYDEMTWLQVATECKKRDIPVNGLVHAMALEMMKNEKDSH